jgi:hypothetical protein
VPYITAVIVKEDWKQESGWATMLLTAATLMGLNKKREIFKNKRL